MNEKWGHEKLEWKLKWNGNEMESLVWKELIKLKVAVMHGLMKWKRKVRKSVVTLKITTLWRLQISKWITRKEKK